jgi:threonine dehydratase
MLPKLTTTPSAEELKTIHQAIKPYIHQTPVLTSQSIDKIAGLELFFKCENFQKIGAFKMRGAMSAALTLNAEELKNGLATHSSGNHAQAVAKAAQFLGVPAYIVMPTNAPSIKKKAVLGYGAQVIDCDSTTAGREAALEKVVAETGAYFIHPYNDYHVIAGQASASMELMAEIPNLNIVMAPVGGGGLMSGTALAVQYFLPTAKAIGAEPQEVDDAYRSLKAGYIIENDTIDTIADGLRTTIREKTFAILQETNTEIILVTESEIISAMRLVWERMKIIIEPSCAVPLAAVLQQKERFKGKRIGIILTGGNVDLEALPF